MSLKVKPTKHYSLASGKLAAGCRKCVKGEKLVLFVTGLCSQRCDFCPISDKKLFKDVVYANERPLEADEDFKGLVDEARVSRSSGAGITGGDPLMRVMRVAKYIRKLKSEFGKRFHIHLYTPLNLVTESRLKALHEAGLDEIRFHPDLNRKEQWDRILLARKYPWSIGVEIPAIPGRERETRELLSFLPGKIDFLNINELELADNKVWRNAKDARTKDSVSYAIKGSDELARKLISYSTSIGLPTHYCTCKLKDRVQLAQRVKRRAKSARLPTDRVLQDGMLLRGAIYLPELKPGFGYRDKLGKISLSEKGKILKRLESIKARLGVRSFVDRNKLRLLTSERSARKVRKSSDYLVAIVLEYPTFDALELEVEFLG